MRAGASRWQPTAGCAAEVITGLVQAASPARRLGYNLLPHPQHAVLRRKDAGPVGSEVASQSRQAKCAFQRRGFDACRFVWCAKTRGLSTLRVTHHLRASGPERPNGTDTEQLTPSPESCSTLRSSLISTNCNSELGYQDDRLEDMPGDGAQAGEGQRGEGLRQRADTTVPDLREPRQRGRPLAERPTSRWRTPSDRGLDLAVIDVEMDRIIALISEILRKSTRGPYVYRGEPECYEVASSKLFRAFADGEDEMFNLARVEEDFAWEAGDYVASEDADDEYGEIQILAEIQHFGGTTNLIDFTEDYLIALFFASAGHHLMDGRIVLHPSQSDNVVRPKRTSTRAVFQKSVMVRPPRGFLVPDDEETVIVPGDLKAAVREYLEHCHGISEKRVYDDIHGYIQNQDVRTPYVTESRARRSAYRSDMPDLDLQLVASSNKIRRGTVAIHYFHQRGMEYAPHAGSIFVLEADNGDGESEDRYVLSLRAGEVVDLMTACIEDGGRCVTLGEAYCWRGGAHVFLGSVEAAEADFAKAMELSEFSVEAHHGRANVRTLQGDESGAIADLEEALRLSPTYVPANIDLGTVHLEAGRPGEAAKYFDVAVDGGGAGTHGAVLFIDSHFYRAVARCVDEDWDRAKADFQKARQVGLRVARSFRNVFGGVQKFESDYGLRLPSLVKAELHVPGGKA